VQKAVWEAVVAATKLIRALLLSMIVGSTPLIAAVLPADRADILYHSFDGGGAEVTGPSVLVRKEVADTVSIYGNYYVDMVSSASIDVQATASPYSEERTETSVGIDYLNDKSVFSLSYTNSSEDDYEAQTVSFGISQDFFGDLSTIGLGFSQGNDLVGNNTDDSFSQDTEHRRYNVSLTQILTKNLIASAVFESVIDQGYLNNPYRSVRYQDSSAGRGYSYEAELYPSTRNSDALSLRALYYLPYRAALKLEYRHFSDSWGIVADSYEARYTHPFANGWLMEFKYRAYEQSSADFYSDLFDFSEATNFRARDKELSSFGSQTVGLGISYEFKPGFIPQVDKSTLNLYWDHIQFNYDDFRDVTSDQLAGEEPLYSFDANVIRLYLSVWY